VAQRPWEKLRSRKRDDDPDAGGRDDDEKKDDNVHLDSDEQAWWAKRDVQQGYTSPPKKPPAQPSEPPKRDTFSEYFSTESLFDHNKPRGSGDDTGSSEADYDPGPFQADDPYVVLGVPSTASWEEIMSAHRRLAKLHHPDRLLHANEVDRHRSESRMRDINIAYSELRRRRGK
jgi:DnaJ-domain-containing protein 1